MFAGTLRPKSSGMYAQARAHPNLWARNCIILNDGSLMRS
jgi:hypothetical protein